MLGIALVTGDIGGDIGGHNSHAYSSFILVGKIYTEEHKNFLYDKAYEANNKTQ